jgi:peptidyl-prolyl cis-trans isomerase D
MAVVAIALVFIIQFRPATGGQAVEGPTCAAEVGGECVTTPQFTAAYRLIAPRNADADRLRAMGLRRQVMEGLIDRQLLVKDAKRLGVTISDDEVTVELANGRGRVSLPADKLRQLGYALGLADDSIRFLPVKNPKTDKFDPKIYEKEIRVITKLSPTDFRDFERDELLADRMRDLIRQRVRVSEAEAFAQFAREKSTATIESVKLDRRFFTEVVIDPSPKAIDAWAAKNKDEIEKIWQSRKAQFTPECRVLRHVLARVDPEAVDPAADKARAKQRIDEALERVTKGESFASVARQLSEDPGSAVRGGELGCVKKGKMVKPFDDAAFALGEGKLSGVVESEYGYHLIRVEKIAKDGEAEAIGHAQTTRELYFAQESERLAAEAAKQILAAVKGGKSLDEAVKTYLASLTPPKDKADKGDKSDKKSDASEPARPTAENHPLRPAVEASMPFPLSGEPLTGARPGTNVAQIAFALDKPGDTPDDIVPLETGYAVIQLKEKTAATKEQWATDRDFYVSAMTKAKQSDALSGYVQRLRSGVEIKINQTLITEPKSNEPGGGEDGE